MFVVLMLKVGPAEDEAVMTGILLTLASAAALVLVAEIGRAVYRQELAGRCRSCEGSGRAWNLPNEDWCALCTGTGRRHA